MDNKTLMFSLGVTKAGTSWFRRYLCGHPECALPEIKELHYFDRTLPQFRDKEIADLEAIRADLLLKTFGASGKKAERLIRRLEELEAWIAVMKAGGVDHDLYRNFITSRAGSDTRLIADVTPAYGLMDEPTLIQMRDIMPDTRFVILLRDPLDRLWSNLRMMAGWRSQDDENIADTANYLFGRVLKGEEQSVAERSDYVSILTRVQNVIPKERLHIEFYENLFTQASIDKICAFLGLSPRAGEFDRVYHASKPAKLDPSRALAAREILIPHYDYVQQLLGDVPARWHQNREVLT